MTQDKTTIKTDTVLFFDLDGTLVDTNFANFLSYQKAIKSVHSIDTDVIYNPKERFNRNLLDKVIPNLTKTQYEKIIQQKETNYEEHLPYTKLITPVADLLVKFSKTNRTVLVTNCRKDRALLTLNYHNLTDKFNNLFFRLTSIGENRSNKFKNAISCLNLPVESIVVFENETQEIEDAVVAGILIENIFSI